MGSEIPLRYEAGLIKKALFYTRGCFHSVNNSNTWKALVQTQMINAR